MNKNSVYKAYCDGSYQESIKAGGWSAIILQDDIVVKRLYQGYKNTTNNRMEIMALIGALECFKEPIKITIYSDSMYVVNSINEKWVYDWISNPDSDKKNLDLWNKLVMLLQIHDVEIVWVKGHNNNQYNEFADILAVQAAKCLNIKTDDYTINI